MLQIVMRTLVPGSWPVRVRVDFLPSLLAESLPPGADEALAALKKPVAAYLRESRKGTFPVL
jgi:hypothetical protein